MLCFSILLALGASFTQPGLLQLLASFATPLQTDCAKLFPLSFIHRDLSQSFLCGLPLKDETARQVFQETSLLHLMVVSGSHLQWMAFLILILWPRKIRQHKLVQTLLWSLLLFYCFVTGFQAPVVRAFVSRLLSFFNIKFSWNWDGGKIQMASGIFLLLFIPEWIFSFSFYLSWLAAVGFLLAPLCRHIERPGKFSEWMESWLSCALIQTLMSVFFFQFSFLGLLMNALLAPLIAICLLPLSFLAAVLPSTSHLADRGWEILLWILRWIVDHFDVVNSNPTAFDSSSLRWIFLWSFLTGLHVFFEALRRQRYQKSYV